MKPISIILTNRNTLEFLKLAIGSIRKNQSVNHEIIIMDDNSNDGSKEWLQENQNKYQYKYFTHDDKERHGIVGMVDEGIKQSENDIVYILHSDMYVAKGFDENLVKHLKPRTVVSSTRIEPPIHPEQPCKIIQNFGVFANEFKEDDFNKFAFEIAKQNKHRITDGVFAPTLCYKKDWLGHDSLFYPQSREDSDWQYEMKSRGYNFIQSWDSIVYHFTSRGSRFNNETKETLQNSKEWQITNSKNMKNFIRKWGTTPLYTQFQHPVVYKKIPISATVLACERDKDYVVPFLSMIEPYFDEIVFIIDSSKDTLKSSIEDEINRYSNSILQFKPTNFSPEKIKTYHRKLNNDFAAQTNFAIEKCSNEWIMKIDLDEQFSEQFLNSLPVLIKEAELQNKTVIGFPRINILNGVVVNDIPRNEWTEIGLMKYPTTEQNPNINVKNPDLQFRLHKQNIKWHGKVHEVPEPVLIRKHEVMLTENYFFHPKTINRQHNQDNMYNQINNKTEIKNIIYDSVIFTTEGITKHAREEILRLNDRGYKIQILDPYRFNNKIEKCAEFKKFYEPIDVVNDKYITICNQPPERWGKTINYNNFIGYLAFEGYLPANWVEIINQPQVKELWTPSEYCKKCFIKSGVKKPIYIVPHGIDPEVWTNLNLKKDINEPFTYLWMGTHQNPRKGMDIMIKAFSEIFKPEDNVRLILKVNKIYKRELDPMKLIQKHINPNGNKNIYLIDDELTETEMVELVNKCDVFVSPHRSEGFGINILQALATGIPVIATKATGNMEFCNEKNTLFIETEKHDRWAPFIYPYLNSQWPEPKIESLKEQMLYVKENYDKCKERSVKEAKKIREEWTWNKVINLMERRIRELN